MIRKEIHNIRSNRSETNEFKKKIFPDRYCVNIYTLDLASEATNLKILKRERDFEYF